MNANISQFERDNDVNHQYVLPQREESNEYKIDDVLYNSWGYEQTNIDFVKIIGFTTSNKSAVLVGIGQKIEKSNENMSEYVSPDKSVIKGKPFTKRISERYIGKYFRFDGEPLYQSHYA